MFCFAWVIAEFIRALVFQIIRQNLEVVVRNKPYVRKGADA